MSPYLDDFHFLRPGWLWLLPVCLVLLWLMHRPQGSLAAWQRICDPRLLQFLTFGKDGRPRRWPLILASVTWLLAIVSVAGPVWEQRPTPLFRSDVSRVVVFDLSRSMLSSDLKPNRLEQAKFKLADLLDTVDEGQVALVAFAGEAFVVSPLTQDANTVKAMLGAVDPSIMPVQGSELGEGLALAGILLERVGAAAGQVILMTDSVGVGGLPAARSLLAAGHHLSVLGVGTPQGAPIPDAGGGFYKADDGSIVIPRLEEGSLQELATAGGGIYIRMRTDRADIDRLMDPEAGKDGLTGDSLLQESLQWREEGPWLLLLLLPLAALAFRRGWLTCFAVLVLLPPVESQAMPQWDNLWKRPDQQAADALNQGRHDDAAALAEDPLLRGEALFRAEDYEAAERAFGQSQGPDGHYNRGNALARQQKFQEAIEAYDQALETEPGMEDAEYNKKLVEELLKQQQEQEQQQQDQENQSENDETTDSQQQGEESESESEEQQKQDQAAEEQESEESSEQPVEAEELDAEEKQALEQWLRRIPDDPGGLLRRKFMLEYQRRGSPPPVAEDEW